MRSASGFTLIEIMVVVIIMGIILALAAPNFSKGYSHFQLTKTGDDLVNVSRWAQAMAIGQERVYALSFSQDRRTYGLIRAKSSEDGENQGSFEQVPGNLGRRHPVSDSVRLQVQEDQLKFYPDGTIDPSIIQLESSNQKIILSSVKVRGMMVKTGDQDS